MIEVKTSVLNRVKRQLKESGPTTAGVLHTQLAITRETLVHSLKHFADLGLIQKVVGQNWKRSPRYKLK